MSTASKRRMAENEVMFRQYNEHARQSLEKLAKEIDAADKHLLGDIDLPLQFYCECSDENCHQRITLKPSVYKKLHQNSSQFLILPGHKVGSIERTVRREPNYLVVEKYMTPPKTAKRFHKTDIDNP